MIWMHSTVAIVISISLAGGAWYTYSKGKRSGMQTIQMKWDAERLASQTDRANREVKARQREQELSNATEVHAQEIVAVNAARAADRAAGAVVAVRLRDAGRETAKLAGQVCADSATARVREAAADAAGVLADLRERADERAGVLADVADNAHFAGAACERRYAQVRETINKEN